MDPENIADVATDVESAAPSETGETTDPQETETAAPPAEEAEAEPAETEQPSVDEGSDLVEELKRSLRATTAERSRLAKENAELREYITRLAEQQPAQSPPPAVDERALGERGLQKLTRLHDPELEGLWFDPTDGTVCIGNPDDVTDWVKPEVAKAVVAARRLQQEKAELAQRQYEQTVQEALQNVAKHVEDTARSLRQRLLPTVADEKAGALVDQMVLAETARRLGAEGITQQHFATLDQRALDRTSEVLHDVVRDFRTLIAEISRAENATLTKAARTQPVTSAGGAAAVEREKSAADMTASEHSEYLRDAFRKFLSRHPS
jgi:hypothetical protein